MQNTNVKNQTSSPLTQAALALDLHFSELIRLGSKIDDLGMKSDSDFEQAERLMKHFAEHGEGVAHEIVLMSEALTEARAQAEAAAKLVSVRAEQLETRKKDERMKMESFRALGEKVRELTLGLSELKKSDDAVMSDEDREKMSVHLKNLESRLHPLIEEATTLRKEAHSSKMKILEQSADSLSQTLCAVGTRLSSFHGQAQN